MKEIKSLLTDHLVSISVLKKDVSLHRKMWGSLVAILLSVTGFIIQKRL